ncbi:hypothetical protein Q9L58_009491 [Maublancomyces gigas]|uniref:Uncharacterized protein n=1 Tax=Discina gigas TaxID=1032678 RepID=A0ABR3G6Q2_9PEZI
MPEGPNDPKIDPSFVVTIEAITDMGYVGGVDPTGGPTHIPTRSLNILVYSISTVLKSAVVTSPGARVNDESVDYIDDQTCENDPH